MTILQGIAICGPWSMLFGWQMLGMAVKVAKWPKAAKYRKIAMKE